MPINPAIEEKIVEVMKSPAMERVLGCESTAIARGVMNDFDGEILPDILRRTFSDIYQLGVSAGREYQFKQDLEAIKSKK